MNNKPYSVLISLDGYSIYEFVNASNPESAIQAALEAHDWAGQSYSVELVIDGHHIDAR